MRSDLPSEMVCWITPGIWFEWQKGLPAAFVALCGVIITGIIAWRQYRVARAKLNLDLYERRYQIFYTTWGYLSEATALGAYEDKLAVEFQNLIPQASFIFGSEVESYMREVLEKVQNLRVQNTKTKIGSMADEARVEFAALNSWVENAAKKGVHEKFAKYLDFGKW